MAETTNEIQVLQASAPRILIIEDQEWSGRALESIFASAGFEVVHARNGRDGMAVALAVRPDAILIDVGLPDIDGMELCRALAGDARVGSNTPLLVTTAATSNHGRRLEALNAGAWEFVPLPPHAAELTLKLRTWIAARRAGAQLCAQCRTELLPPAEPTWPGSLSASSP